MNILGLDIAQIAELGTLVATSGAFRVAESVADDVFEYTVGIVILVHETHPR